MAHAYNFASTRKRLRERTADWPLMVVREKIFRAIICAAFHPAAKGLY
jgi:hypothetical protein